jgi:hypothetical protein
MGKLGTNNSHARCLVRSNLVPKELSPSSTPMDLVRGVTTSWLDQTSKGLRWAELLQSSKCCRQEQSEQSEALPFQPLHLVCFVCLVERANHLAPGTKSHVTHVRLVSPTASRRFSCTGRMRPCKSYSLVIENVATMWLFHAVSIFLNYDSKLSKHIRIRSNT